MKQSFRRDQGGADKHFTDANYLGGSTYSLAKLADWDGLTVPLSIPMRMVSEISSFLY
jgi:hypothetical protein